MPAYKRPIWVWVVIVAFAALAAFAAFLWSASRPPHLVSNVGRTVTMDELRKIDEQCQNTPWWADLPPECAWVGYAKNGLATNVFTGAVAGLVGMVIANWVARKAEEHIEDLIETVNGLDSGNIVPSHQAKVRRRAKAPPRSAAT